MNNLNDMKFPKIFSHLCENNISNYNNKDDVDYVNIQSEDIYQSSDENDIHHSVLRHRNKEDLFETNKFKEQTNMNSQLVQTSFNDGTIPLDNKQNNLSPKLKISKPINPLYCSIDEKNAVNKSMTFHINKNAINFKENSFEGNNYYQLKKDYMKQRKNNSNKVYEKNIPNKQLHNSFNTVFFDLNCCNKTIKDKIKLKTDIKKLIFNNNKDSYEDKCKMIKNINKHEMINRSSGHGMFLYNYNFRNNQRSMKNIQKRMQLDESDEQEKIQINLRKINWFGKKSNKGSVNIFFRKSFFKMTYEDYKELQKKNKEKKLKENKINYHIKQLYEKSSKWKEKIVKLKDKNNKKMNEKQKCEKIKYIIKERNDNNKNINPSTHLCNMNQKNKVKVEGALVKTI
jgi:hypothetical protein